MSAQEREPLGEARLVALIYPDKVGGQQLLEYDD